METDTKKFLILSVLGLAGLVLTEFAIYKSWKYEASQSRPLELVPSLAACTALIEAHPRFLTVEKSAGTLSRTLNGIPQYVWPPGTVRLKYPENTWNARPVECHGWSAQVAVREAQIAE